MGKALTEMTHIRDETWDKNGKELESLTFKMQNYPKILKKVSDEIARREKYNNTIDQLMTILTRVQGQDAQKRKQFNLKYAKYCVEPDMQQ